MSSIKEKQSESKVELEVESIVDESLDDHMEVILQEDALPVGPGY